MSIDLENFPTSEKGKELLSYVTAHWYDNSYVGKWVYQVIGLELDEVAKYIEEMPYQFFVDTATWGLYLHEIKAGLTIREDLSYEERRLRIKKAVASKAPLSPYKMEQLVEEFTGYQCEIHDCNESGYETAFSHPNTFSVKLIGDGAISTEEAMNYINSIKQSHTVAELSFVLFVVVTNEQADIPKITFRWPFYWWRGRKWNGEYIFDGSIAFDQERPPVFKVVYRFEVEDSKETMDWATYIPAYDATFDGDFIFDGTVKFDSGREEIE